MHPTSLIFLLCLMPDNFTCDDEITDTQWVSWTVLLVKICPVNPLSGNNPNHFKQ